MSDQWNIPPKEDRPSEENGWQEVGRQFQTLGESLAQAVRTGWENEETQRRVQEMRTGLESMVRDVSKAFEESANSPEGQRIRADASRAAESLRSATEETVQEARPQIINALQQLNNELQKLVGRMEEKKTPPASSQSPENSDPEI